MGWHTSTYDRKDSLNGRTLTVINLMKPDAGGGAQAIQQTIAKAVTIPAIDVPEPFVADVIGDDSHMTSVRSWWQHGNQRIGYRYGKYVEGLEEDRELILEYFTGEKGWLKLGVIACSLAT